MVGCVALDIGADGKIKFRAQTTRLANKGALGLEKLYVIERNSTSYSLTLKNLSAEIFAGSPAGV